MPGELRLLPEYSPGERGSHDRCRATLVDGVPVTYHGDEEMPPDVAQAFAVVVRAARIRFDAEHADDPPVLAVVADACRAMAERRGMRGSEVARELGMKHAVVVRLMQHSANLTVAELAALARWAGLDVTAVPAGDA